MQQDLEDHVPNGAMGEAHVPSTLQLSWLLPAGCFLSYFLLRLVVVLLLLLFLICLFIT